MIVMKHSGINVGTYMPAVNEKKYRIARDIVIPKGTKVVQVSSMKQHITRAVTAVVGVGKDAHFDWIMFVDDALATGMIEEAD